MKALNFLLAFLLVCGVMAAPGDSSAPGSGEKREAKVKTCFQCDGTGKNIQCERRDCKGGRVECPGRCVKMSGKWVKRNTPGDDPNKLWQLVKFYPRGQGYVSQGHVGEYFTVDASGAVTPHTCETCKGAAMVNCPVCKGSPTCTVCEGKKNVPDSWSAFDHPKMADRPSRFKMKDGSEIIGRKRKALDTRVTIRTEKGDVEVEKADIVKEEKQYPGK